MAFPVIQTADTKNGTVTSNTNSWTLTYPTNLVAGDLILGVIGADGFDINGDTTWPSGFNHWLQNGNSACMIYGAVKIADGTETGTFSVTLDPGQSEQGGWRVLRITGWYGSGLIATGSNLVSQKDADGMAAVGAGSSSANPNPPNLDPANWGTEDTLWIAVCAADTSRTISVFPLASNNSSDVSGGAGGATLGICTLNDTVASKDPGTFTISASDDWAAVTIAIRPAAAGKGLPSSSSRRRFRHILNRSVIASPRLWLPERPKLWLPGDPLPA